eukprot:6311741-Amphidinium_carterae.2
MLPNGYGQCICAVEGRFVVAVRFVCARCLVPNIWSTSLGRLTSASPFDDIINVIGERRRMTNKEIGGAAKELCKAMQKGTYLDVNQQLRAIGGDLHRLRYVEGLFEGAKPL